MKEPDTNDYPFVERRSGKDRRDGQTLPFMWKSLLGTRRGSRRREDARKYYFVDVYSPFFLAVLICTMILSLTDALLTLKLVGENYRELNPVMGFFMQMGPYPFLFVKWLLTAVGLTVLLVFKNYYLWGGKIRGQTILVIFPFLYLILISYEICLVWDR
jgi:hypothetical protein